MGVGIALFVGLTTVYASVAPSLGRADAITAAMFVAVAVTLVLVVVVLATRAYPRKA